MKAPLPANEAERLRALRAYRVMDTPPELAFDDLTHLAAQICRTPTALVTLIDEERQWFKSMRGFTTSETRRDLAFCAHSILRRDVMVVPDATKDPRFADNSLVTGAPHIRFYAGAPLITATGFALGSLAVIDYVPRDLTAEQIEELQVLSRQAVAQLELRRQMRDQHEHAHAALLISEARYRTLFEYAPDGIVIADSASTYLDANASMCRMLGYTRDELIGMHASDIVNSTEIPHIGRALSEIKARSDYQREWQFRRKDGSVFAAEVIATTMPDGNLLGLIRDITERKCAETERQQVFERITDAFVALDKNWRYTYLNAKAGELFGRRPADLIGKHIWTEFPEGVGQKFHLAYEKAMADQQPVFLEECYPPYDRWFENRIYPSPEGLTIYFHDITERKKSEGLLNGQKQLLELIATGAPLAETLAALVNLIEAQSPEMLCTVLLLDADGVHVRHGAAPSLPAEFVRVIDGQPIGPSAGSCGTAAFRREPVVVEDIATDPLWTDYRGAALLHGLRACWSTPIFDAHKKVLGTFAIYYRKPGRPTAQHQRLIDIATQTAAVAIGRQQAEAEARLLTQRLTLATDAAAIGIWDWDLETDRWYATPVYFTMLGYHPEEGFSDRSIWLRRLHPDDQAAVGEKIRALLAGSEAPYHYEARMRHADGGYRWIYVAGRVLSRDEHGKASRLLGVRIDITERKQAEQKLQESREQLRALLARLQRTREEERIRVSREIHDELGQLLTGLKMDVRWLERKLSTPDLPPALRPLLDRAVAASEMADATIATVQKIAAELRPGALDQLGLTVAVRQELRRFEERSGIRCTFTPPAEPGPLLPPEIASELFYICREALTNVARHAHATHVELYLRTEDTDVILGLCDDGVGMAATELNAPHSLGLLGMKERAAQCGGTVSFERNEPRGTRVIVRIPRRAMREG